MLVRNELAVATYGPINNGARPPVGDLDNNTLQHVFGKDNRTEWTAWNGNGDNAGPFINAINTLCRN